MKKGDRFRITITGVLTLTDLDAADFHSINDLRADLKSTPQIFVYDLNPLKVTVAALRGKRKGK